jgi:tRNA threonylcarbamoyladenosine biosynthesis protein TsaB
MNPRFAAPVPPSASTSLPAADAASAVADAAVGRPMLLALAVHWDDCSVALGNRINHQSETWSQQPERTAPAGDIRSAAAGGASPVASRDALLLLDRLLVRTGTSLSGVDRLCFARGPGAFTSLRVAAGIAQGLSLATSIPAVGICSLAALVAHESRWRVADGEDCWLQLSAVDARMGECYFAAHRCRGGEHPTPVMGPAVGSAAVAIARFEETLADHAGSDVVIAGNAFRLLPPLSAWARQAGQDPDAAGAREATAAAVLALADSAGASAPGAAHTALPVYVRDKIALDVAEQRANAAARAQAAVDARLTRAGS